MVPFIQIVLIVVLAAAPVASARELPALPGSLDLSAIRQMAVQHDGRWPPLDTVARDVVEQVTGDAEFRGHDPVLILLAWTLDPQPWQDARLITIGNAEVRGELQLDLDRQTFSYHELVNHDRLRQVTNDLRGKSGKEMDPLDKEASHINDRLGLLHEALSGQTVRPVPDPQDRGGAWYAPTDRRGEGSSPVARTWAALKAAFLADDDTAFDTSARTLIEQLDALPAAYRPGPNDLRLEVRVNQLQPFLIAFYLMAAATVAAAVNMFAPQGVARVALSVLTFAGIVAGFVLISYGIGVRWHLAGRIPAANMYESMLFLAWGVGAFDIIAIVLLRHPIISFKSGLMATGALALVNFVGLDWPIRPVAPVLLDTVWMAIHVPTIMVSYSVLFDAFVIAHIQLFTLAAAPRKRHAIQAIDQLHYWFLHVGSILLFAGIVTGSMWAAYSWGRYWGWDPKEVWSLIAYLAYLAVMHVRLDRRVMPGWMKAGCVVLVVAMFAALFRLFVPADPVFVASLIVAGLMILVFVTGRGGALSTAIKSTLAAWMVGMTYVGVNYVLGIGLHSYGFGAGRVVYYALWSGAIDLSIITACVLVYLARGGWADLTRRLVVRSPA